MLITEIKLNLRESNKFKVRNILYKSKEDREKYGESFEAMSHKDFCYIEVNFLTFRVKRIIEEYGMILFIYNGNQIEIEPENITTLRIL